MGNLPALSVLTIESSYTKPPPYEFFKFVWGLPGVHVLGVPPPAVRAEMWGPVVIDGDSI